jgi:ubiquinol-cytochrome c reductase cytochrome b subunit
MLRKLARWIDDRLGTSRFVEESLNKVFPDHWAFLLGEIALYSFVILVLTGIFLSFFFTPSLTEHTYHGPYAPLHGVKVSDAYNSIVNLSFQVRAGLVMRQTHHWAALVFIAAMVVHLCRIYFTGAFRRPREINWMIGVTMLILGILNGFTGYSLPDDLLSGQGVRIMYSVMESVPVIGTWMAFLFFGGDYPSNQIISRLFVLHVMIVPALLAALIGAHLAIVWRQKHTQFKGAGKREDNVVGPRLWPTYAFSSVGLFFGIFAVLTALGGLVQINPVWLYGPYRADQVTSPAQPDWFLGWLEGALRIFPNFEPHIFGFIIPNLFFPAVLLPGITFMLLYLWPFIEARFTSDYDTHHLLDDPRDKPMRTALGAATLAFYVMLFFAASNDVIAKSFNVPVGNVTWVFRGLVLGVPPLVGLIVHRLFKALKRDDPRRITEMPLDAVIEP